MRLYSLLTIFSLILLTLSSNPSEASASILCFNDNSPLYLEMSQDKKTIVVANKIQGGIEATLERQYTRRLKRRSHKRGPQKLRHTRVLTRTFLSDSGDHRAVLDLAGNVTITNFGDSEEAALYQCELDG